MDSANLHHQKTDTSRLRGTLGSGWVVSANFFMQMTSPLLRWQIDLGAGFLICWQKCKVLVENWKWHCSFHWKFSGNRNDQKIMYHLLHHARLGPFSGAFWSFRLPRKARTTRPWRGHFVQCYWISQIAFTAEASTTGSVIFQHVFSCKRSTLVVSEDVLSYLYPHFRLLKCTVVGLGTK